MFGNNMFNMAAAAQPQWSMQANQAFTTIGMPPSAPSGIGGSTSDAPPTVTNAVSSDQVLSSKSFRTLSMDDGYPNLLSVESCVSTSTTLGQGRRTNKPTLKFEMKKDGFEVKEGHNIWNLLTEDIKEDVLNTINTYSPGNVKNGSCKGQKIFQEVEYFLSQPNPKVKDLRQKIPKSVLLLFNTRLVAEGREKVRDMWAPEHKPVDWDPETPFVDPNNGQKLKKDEGLKTMFDFLQRYFKEHRQMIVEILGLNTPPEPAKNKYQAKVEAQTERSRKDLNQLKKNDIVCHSDVLSEKVAALEARLDDNRTPSEQFKMASSIEALSIKVHLEHMPETELIQECNKISEYFCDHHQPQSGDQGTFYLGNNGAHPVIPTTADFRMGPMTFQGPTMNMPESKLKSDTDLSAPAPETSVLTENAFNACDSLVAPSQFTDGPDLLEMVIQNPGLVEVPMAVKRIGEELGEVPEKKIKEEHLDVTMANGFLLSSSQEALAIKESGMAVTGIERSQAVDVSEVMKDVTNNPTLVSYLDDNITPEEAKLLQCFFIPADGSSISVPKLTERVPATMFQTQTPGMGIIPSTVEAMETDEVQDYLNL